MKYFFLILAEISLENEIKTSKSKITIFFCKKSKKSGGAIFIDLGTAYRSNLCFEFLPKARLISNTAS